MQQINGERVLPFFQFGLSQDAVKSQQQQQLLHQCIFA